MIKNEILDLLQSDKVVFLRAGHVLDFFCQIVCSHDCLMHTIKIVSLYILHVIVVNI